MRWVRAVRPSTHKLKTPDRSGFTVNEFRVFGRIMGFLLYLESDFMRFDPLEPLDSR